MPSFLLEQRPLGLLVDASTFSQRDVAALTHPKACTTLGTSSASSASTTLPPVECAGGVLHDRRRSPAATLPFLRTRQPALGLTRLAFPPVEGVGGVFERRGNATAGLLALSPVERVGGIFHDRRDPPAGLLPTTTTVEGVRSVFHDGGGPTATSLPAAPVIEDVRCVFEDGRDATATSLAATPTVGVEAIGHAVHAELDAFPDRGEVAARVLAVGDALHPFADAREGHAGSPEFAVGTEFVGPLPGATRAGRAPEVWEFVAFKEEFDGRDFGGVVDGSGEAEGLDAQR